MTQTLRRERKQKFLEILEKYYQDNPPTDHATEFNKEVAELLADASISVSEETQDKEKNAEKHNAPLFRGDFHDYPEHLWIVAETLRDTWKFNLPAKPQKKSKRTEKSKYGMFCMAMEDIKSSCAEFGADALVKVHADWKAGFKGGIAPYTVAQPSSLINMCAAKARELREGKELEQSKPSRPPERDENGFLKSY